MLDFRFGPDFSSTPFMGVGLLTYSLSGQVSIRELSDEVAREDDSRQSVYVALCQSHLPKMDRHSVVSYDQDDGEVASGENFETVVQALSYVRKQVS